MIDWPEIFQRTSSHERARGSPYSASLAQTVEEIEDEMRRLGVDDWRASTGSGGSYTFDTGMPKHNANPDDPGFVLRWSKEGDQFAVACDGYANLRDNVRTVYLWINETRMRGQRPVVTGEDDFATARLPPGDPERDKIVTRQPPHEVLGVQPDADPAVVNAAYRQLTKKHSPDTGGDRDDFIRLTKAKEAMLE